MNIKILSADDFLGRYFNAEETADIFYEIECHGNSRPPYWDKKNYMEILKENVHLAISCDVPATTHIDGTNIKDVQAFMIYCEIAPELEILHWAIREKGHGHGEEFLRQFLKRCHAAKILLDCGEDNKAAKALYDKLGFKMDNRRENYYASSEAALLMSLEL